MLLEPKGFDIELYNKKSEYVFHCKEPKDEITYERFVDEGILGLINRKYYHNPSLNFMRHLTTMFMELIENTDYCWDLIHATKKSAFIKNV